MKVYFWVYACLLVLCGICISCLSAESHTYNHTDLILREYGSYNNLPPDSIDTVEVTQNRDYRIHFELERTIESSKRKSAAIKKQGFFIEAQAGAPPRDEYIPLDSIRDIRITCSNDFDSLHPALSDVSNYFMINNTNDSIASLTTLKEEIKLYLKREYSYDSPTTWFNINIFKNPTLDSLQTFNVELELNNGNTFSASTKPVVFRNINTNF